MIRLHATCVAIGGRGVLLLGPSGAGKSDLALRLIDRGARLVSDDQVALEIIGGRLEATSLATIWGRMEVRGIGVIALPPEALADRAPVALAIALDQPPQRMAAAPLPTRDIAGLAVPEIALAPFEASAPLKVERALALLP